MARGLLTASAMNALRRNSDRLFALLLLLVWRPVIAQQADATQLASVAQRFAVEAHADARFPVRSRAASNTLQLRLAHCSSALTAELPIGARWTARTLVLVRCPGAARWSVLIPVDIESQVPVLVLRSAAIRGSLPGPGEWLQETRWVAGTTADYVNSLDALPRHHLRRNLSAGSVLRAADLEADILVQRGQTVTVLAQVGALRIQAEAVALADARAGERVKLQNQGSLKVFDGTVDEVGQVRVLP